MSRRFLYRANALALGGRLFKPTPAVIESQTSVVLPISGGVGRGESGPFRYGDLLAYERASVYVLCNDGPDGAYYSAETYVRIDGLDILGRVRIRSVVGRLTSLHARSANGVSAAPVNRVDPSGSLIDGLTVDGTEVKLESHVGLLAGLPEYGSLTNAYRTNRQPFADVANNDFFWNGGALAPGAPSALAEVAEQCAKSHAASRGGVQAPALTHGLLPCRLFGSGRVPAGVAAQSFPGALVVQGVGVLHFGEYLIGPDSRRLTMLRLELNTAQMVAPGPRSARGRAQALRADGSGDGRSGDIDIGNIETNGHPWP